MHNNPTRVSSNCKSAVETVATNVQINLREAEYKAKQDSRESAIKKLAEIAGLTKEELASIL